MRTFEDGEGYVADVMHGIGFKQNELGKWVIDEANNGAKSADAFITRFNQTAQLRLIGKTDAEIAEGLVRKGRDELYTIFHGDTEAFNENLLSMIKFKMNLCFKI